MNGTARRVEVDDLGQLAEGSRLATGARVAVIVNRGAGRLPDRAWEERAAAILARRLRPTFEHPVSGAETARLAAEHARAGVAAVVVAGGDGTINRVVNELAGTGVPIGILPRGTANDFAREVDLPLEIAAAARRVLEGGVRAIDVIDVNGRAFVTVGGLGLPAACALSVGRLKRAGGLALVALAALGPAVYPVVAAANVLLRARRLHRLRITYRRPDGRLRTVERESRGPSRSASSHGRCGCCADMGPVGERFLMSVAQAVWLATPSSSAARSTSPSSSSTSFAASRVCRSMAASASAAAGSLATTRPCAAQSR